MKLFRSFLLSAFLLTASFGLQAQQNYGIAYQAVARDAGGDALENATLDVRFTLLDAASSSVWTETHSGVLTDEFGLINLTIGSVAGAADLAAVDWSAGGYSFQVEVNSGGGFASFGMMAVTAVPVAMFAASAPEGTADSLSVVLAQEIADRAAGDAGLASDNTALAGLIATNTGNIATNGSGISANAGGISTNAGAISTNAGAISTNAGAISTNAGGISTNAGAISTNAGEISTNASGISTNAGAISTNAGEISTNAGGISTNAGAISTNAGEISTNAGGISTNAGAISTNAGEISTNASGISTNAGAISTNAGEISTNAGGIGTNAGAISQLQTDLGTETTNRVAEDATLLGLIQSNDGELLALNTSVGQLQSDLSDLSDLVDANDHFDFDGGVLSTEGDIDQLQFGSTVSVNTSGASSVQLAVTGKILTTNLTVQNDLTVSDNITAGSASFTGNVLSTEAPIADDHLANKGYVDNVVGNEIAGYTQAIIDEAARATLAEAALGVRIDSLDGAHSSEIAQVQSNLDAEILATNGDVTSLQGQVDSNDGDITSIQGALDTLAADVNANSAATVSNFLAIQNNDGDITALQGVDDTLALDVNANAAAILSNDGDISTNAGAISTNASDISTNAGDISTNAAAILANDGDIAANLSAIQANDGDITALQDVDDTLALDVNANAAAILANDGDIASNLSAIGSNDTDITNLQGALAAEIASTNGDVTNLQGQIDVNESDITTLQGVDDTLAVDVLTNAAATVSNFLAIQSNDTDISGLQSDIDQNEIDSDAADGTLQDNINTVQNDVNQNELDSDAADGTLQDNINTVQGDVDQNETDSDAADVTLQGNINTVQNDVNQNEIDSDAADVTLQGNINTVQDELDASQTGAGLGTDGAYTANGSTTYLTGSTSLVDADEDLDAAMKALQDDVDANELASDNAETGLQSELDASQIGAGLGTNGAYTANGSTTYLTGSTSLVDADEDLDAAMKALQDDVDANELASDNAETALQSELDASQTGAGLGTDGTYTANGSTTYLTGSTSLVDADEDLDAAIYSESLSRSAGDVLLNSSIANNTVNVAGNTASITSLSTSVSTNASDIGTLQGDLASEISATNSDVTSLQGQIDNLPTSPAAIAAEVENNDYFDEPIPGVVSAESQVTMLVLPSLAVTGATTLDDVDIDGSLEVSSISTAQVETTGDVIVGDDVITTDDVSVGDRLTVTGTSAFTGAATFSGGITGTVTGTVSDISNHDTGDLTEGSNLYYTDTRSRASVSATDAGGDGSFSYDNSTGVMTYTGPSAAETRAHFSGSTGVTITNGAVAIGQAVGTSDNVTFNNVTANLTGNASGNAGTVTNGVYTTSSVAALSDVSSAGSGAIITSAERTKLAGVDDNATANQTDAHLVSRANHTGTQAAATISDFDAEVSNNTSVTANTAKVSADGLVTTHSDVTSAGSGAIITTVERSKLGAIEANATADQTGAEIKTAYEAETKAFTDAQFDKLAAIDDNATANQTDAHLVSRANHTGTQTAATISDFDAEVSNNTSVTANTAKVSADGLVTTHSDVTSAGSGAIITTVERSKLVAIEANATADQTGAEIKTAYEAETKAFTDAQFDKLAAIEDNADVTDATNVAAAGAVMNTGNETIAGTKTFSSTIQGNLSGNVTGQVSDISNHNTGALAEGSNLYYTDARSRLAVSATDAGGDGSFSYNNTTGVMTYTGPSAADTRAHFSGGTGVTITNGAVAIGQAVAASDAVTFASATTTGNASVGGTLGATGATTLGSTLDVAGAGEFDSTLGTDGNFRVGASGASTFQVNATSGALSTSGDISTTGGVQTGTLIATGTALLQGSTTITTLNVSNYLTLNNEPLLSSHAATKFYVDSEIDSHAHTMPQAYSFMSNGTYTSLGADLGVSAVTITVTGANLAAGTYKLHLDGEELALTVTVGSSTSVSFDLVDSDISGMLTASGRATTTGLFATQLSIDGVATGLTIFVNL